MSPLRYDDDSLFAFDADGTFTAPTDGFYSFGAARANDPRTAKDAAKSMTAPILNRQRRRVLGFVDLYDDGLGGATAWDIAWLSGHKPQQNVAARRLTDLKRLGLVEECGARPGSSGRLCRAFRITDAGREALR